MRRELKAKDFSQVESLEIEGILYVFLNFQAARIGEKIGFSAEAELFRGSLDKVFFNAVGRKPQATSRKCGGNKRGKGLPLERGAVTK